MFNYINKGEMDKNVASLRKAIEGFGTDEAALIKIIANRTNSQRQTIKAKYKATYGRDLVSDLKSECHDKLEDAFVALFTNWIRCRLFKRCYEWSWNKWRCLNWNSCFHVILTKSMLLKLSIRKNIQEL